MTEDTHPQKTSNPGIITGAIFLLFIIAGAAFLAFRSNPISNSSMSYSSTAPAVSTSPIPVNASSQEIPASGTYLKLSVTPHNKSDIADEEAKFCASMLNTNLPDNLSHPVAINPKENFIEVHIGSTDNGDVREVIDYLTKTNKLSIHAVHRQSRILAEAVAAKEEIIPGYIALPHTETDSETGKPYTHHVLIRRKSEITGDDVKAAYVHPRDYSIVNIELNAAGGKKMKTFTLTLTKRLDMIATVFDGKVINYATLNADSLGKNFVITGLETKQEVEDLIKSLQHQLTSTLEVIEKRAYPEANSK